jgi:hypothetical protein
MYKSRTILFLLGLCICQYAFAEISLEVLMEEFSKITHASAKFTERKQLTLLTAPLILEGTLSYHAPDYLKKVVNKPSPSLFEISGESLYIETATEKLILHLDSHPLIRAFAESYRATRSGDSKTLTQYFDADLSGTLENWTLNLSPKDEYVRTRIRTIQMTGSGALIRSVKTVELSGNTSFMKITAAND